jgi:hypothetical protein
MKMTRFMTKLLPVFLLLILPTVVQAQFNYTTNSGTITITKYEGIGGSVSIPSRINGLPVTTIGTNAFLGCNLTNITIPSSVTSIGKWAFANCTNLTSVMIPSSVTSIGVEAFAKCERLTSVMFPTNSATTIGNYAFAECIGLTSLTIPKNVTFTGGHPFWGCIGLTNFTWEGHGVGK